MFYSSDCGLTWSLMQKLVDPNGAANDYFGWSVSVSGAVLAVGARWDDDKGTDSGTAESMPAVAVYISYSTICLTLFMYIYLNDIYIKIYQSYMPFIYLPIYLSFYPSIYLLSFEYILTVFMFYLISNAGSVIVYHSSDGGLTWSLMQKLTDPNGAAGDWFGHSVSVSGAVLVVGAIYDDDKGSNSGIQYLFYISSYI